MDDESVDVVISNGVVNLAPDKSQVFAEIHRVLRPGGRLYLADVVVQRELKYEVRNNPDLWAACIAGALPEPELAELALASGLRDPQITERFDCFRDTTAEAKVARDLHVQAVNFWPASRKPKSARPTLLEKRHDYVDHTGARRRRPCRVGTPRRTKRRAAHVNDRAFPIARRSPWIAAPGCASRAVEARGSRGRRRSVGYRGKQPRGPRAAPGDAIDLARPAQRLRSPIDRRA